MASAYWRKQRQVIFPEIKDWTGPKDELRRNDKSFWYMFYFDRDMYALMKYSACIASFFIMGLLPVTLGLRYHNWIIGLIGVVFLYIYGKQTIITHQSRSWWYGTNLYDELLRDYEADEVQEDDALKD